MCDRCGGDGFLTRSEQYRYQAGKRIRLSREHYGLKRAEVANATSVPLERLIAMEHGAVLPDLSLLLVLPWIAESVKLGEN